MSAGKRNHDHLSDEMALLEAASSQGKRTIATHSHLHEFQPEKQMVRDRRCELSPSVWSPQLRRPGERP